MLKELKALVRKLMNAVKITVSAIAEAMEAARQKMIIFRYQLLRIGTGRRRIANTLHAIQPDIKRYEDTVMQLKAKIKERQVLLNEKKNTPAVQLLQHRKLAQKIAALTEDIEELKNEKALLLNQLDCVDDHGMDQIKQRIGSMESSLQTLNQQKKKYTAELDAALAQYTEQQQQAADMDAIEVDTARQAIRTDKERETARRLQTAYGKKFDSGTLAQSRKDVAEMLGEPAEQVAVHQTLQPLQGQQDGESHKKKHRQER